LDLGEGDVVLEVWFLVVLFYGDDFIGGFCSGNSFGGGSLLR
jgi:hypothetical protein